MSAERCDLMSFAFALDSGGLAEMPADPKRFPCHCRLNKRILARLGTASATRGVSPLLFSKRVGNARSESAPDLEPDRIMLLGILQNSSNQAVRSAVFSLFHERNRPLAAGIINYVLGLYHKSINFATK